MSLQEDKANYSESTPKGSAMTDATKQLLGEGHLPSIFLDPSSVCAKLFPPICFTQQWKNSKGSVFVFQLDEDAIITHNLYSCAGDGRVYQHRTGHFMEDPIDVCALIVKTNDIKVSLMPFERFTSNTACRMSWLRY